MSAIEILALIVAALIVIKTATIFVNPKAWTALVKKLYGGNPVALMVVGFLGAAIILKILLLELTIVQVFAVMMFFMFLGMVAMAPFSKDILPWAEKLLQEDGRTLLKKSWVACLIWLLLVLWVLCAILWKG